MRIGYESDKLEQIVEQYPDTYTITTEKRGVLFYDIKEEELESALEKAEALAKIFGRPQVNFNGKLFTISNERNKIQIPV